MIIFVITNDGHCHCDRLQTWFLLEPKVTYAELLPSTVSVVSFGVCKHFPSLKIAHNGFFNLTLLLDFSKAYT